MLSEGMKDAEDPQEDLVSDESSGGPGSEARFSW